MTTSKFDYYLPSTLEEAAGILAEHGGAAKLLAGGHSLIPSMKIRLASPEILVDLKAISELKEITASDEGLSIGAMVTYRELETSDIVRSAAPVIAEAASVVADTQIRNWGTIGGSISHSDPAGDMPAAVIAMDAQFEVVSQNASRMISAEDMFVDFLTTALDPTEILARIRIPALPANTGTAYAKLPNKASHYALVGVAAAITLDASGICKRARVAITGSGSYARRARQTENALTGVALHSDAIVKAAALAGNEYQKEFNEDVHASAEYREEMTKIFAARSIAKALERAS